MTPESKEQFTWLVDNLGKLAHAHHALPTRPMAEVLTRKLMRETQEWFPELREEIEGVLAEMKKERSVAVKKVMEKEGPALWAKIHKRPFAQVILPDVEMNFLTKEIPRQLPCGQCKGDYMRYLKATPPNFTREGYFAWTVGLHNYVNSKLGKRTYTVEEARALWK